MRWKRPIVVFMGCVLSANLAYADTVRDLVLRGNEYFARGEYERALRQYEAATAADANSFEAVYNTAVTLMRLDRHAEAERLFRTIDASPRGGHLASAARRGLGLSTLGRARERLQALMEQESTGSPAPPPIEGLEEVAGDYEDAAAWFRGALDFDPDDASAARGLEISRGELFALQRIIDQLKDMQSAQQEQESQGAQDQGEPDDSENGDGGQQQGDRDRSDSGGSGEDEPPEPPESPEPSDGEPQNGTEQASQQELPPEVAPDGRPDSAPNGEDSSEAESAGAEPSDDGEEGDAEMSETEPQPVDDASRALDSNIQRLQDFLDREERMREYARRLMRQIEEARRPVEKDW